MKILVSGASGLVGSSLVPRLVRKRHDVRQLTRHSTEDISWDPETGAIDSETLNRWHGPDAVIHLAGENVAARRWSPRQKRRIRESRVESTQRLAESLLKLAHRPSVFISASAVGIYGDRGDELLTESSAPGEGFLSETAVAWEEASRPLADAGVRLVHLRFGMILAREGGALNKMLPVFRCGLGGHLGSGDQWISWISLADVLSVIEAVLSGQSHGPFNVVSPNPVTNREFTRALAATLHRPAILPVPAFGLRLVFGEMAEALLLGSQRAIPQRLSAAGFHFEHSMLPSALRAIVG